MSAPRTRTHAWHPPAPDRDAMRRMSGLDYLRLAFASERQRPPISTLMDFRAATLEHGRAVFEAEPGEYLYNPIGTVHGGFAATLLDSAMSCAVHAALDPGVGYTTVEIKVNYVRPMTSETGTVTAEGRTISVGSRVATAEGRITDRQGRLLAHGTTTCLLFPIQG